jgi:hypothetical protein
LIGILSIKIDDEVPMIRLDRIKIKNPLDALSEYDKSLFHEVTKTDTSTGQIIENYSNLKKNIGLDRTLGIKQIKINHSFEELIIELSAKVLKEKYLDLISRKSLENVIENINNSKVIRLDKTKFIGSAEVLSLDVTRDIRVSKDMKSYFRDLKIFSSLSNYRVMKYKDGVEFYSNSISNKERLKLYSKYHEIKRENVINKEILKFIPESQFFSLMRIEGNLVTQRNIKKYFKIAENETITLSSVLECSENVILEYFDKMIPKLKIKYPAEDFWDSSKSFTELREKIGNLEIIKACGYDLDNVRFLIKTKTKGNPSYYMKNIKNIMETITLKRSEDGFLTIEEIRNLLADEPS